MTPERASAVRELLDFYAEAGVDALLGETPVDRLSATQLEAPPVRTAERTADGGESRKPPLLARPLAPEPPSSVAPAAPDIALMAAREAARSAASLEELRAILSTFEGCALRTTAKQLVFADGNPQARV